MPKTSGRGPAERSRRWRRTAGRRRFATRESAPARRSGPAAASPAAGAGRAPAAPSVASAATATAATPRQARSIRRRRSGSTRGTGGRIDGAGRGSNWTAAGLDGEPRAGRVPRPALHDPCHGHAMALGRRAAVLCTPRRESPVRPLVGSAPWPRRRPAARVPRHGTPSRLLAVGAALTALAAVAPAAHADSISYIKDGAVWLTTPDASRHVQVTHDGGYDYAS